MDALLLGVFTFFSIHTMLWFSRSVPKGGAASRRAEPADRDGRSKSQDGERSGEVARQRSSTAGSTAITGCCTA